MIANVQIKFVVKEWCVVELHVEKVSIFNVESTNIDSKSNIIYFIIQGSIKCCIAKNLSICIQSKFYQIRFEVLLRIFSENLQKNTFGIFGIEKNRGHVQTSVGNMKNFANFFVFLKLYKAASCNTILGAQIFSLET